MTKQKRIEIYLYPFNGKTYEYIGHNLTKNIIKKFNCTFLDKILNFKNHLTHDKSESWFYEF